MTQGKNHGSSGAAAGFTHLGTSDIRDHAIELTRDSGELKRLRTMKCGTITGARLHEEQFTAENRRRDAIFLTLTYANGGDWNPRHISELFNRLRQWLKRRSVPFRYVWVAELQQRGALHYHVILWVPKNFRIPLVDKNGWWPYGRSNTQRAKNPVGYIAKYASKGSKESGKFPRGARIYACGGLGDSGKSERRWWLSPCWIKKRTGGNVTDCIRVKGGWINRDTGEWLPSPYMVVKIDGAICLVEIENVEDWRRS